MASLTPKGSRSLARGATMAPLDWSMPCPDRDDDIGTPENEPFDLAKQSNNDRSRAHGKGDTEQGSNCKMKNEKCKLQNYPGI